MPKQYVIWWHNYVYDISQDATTIEEIYNSVTKTLQDLNKLKILEEKGKIKVKETGTLNPLFIEILDASVEQEIKFNPIVDIVEK